MLVKRALSIAITVGIIFSITTKVMADGEPQRIWGKDRCDTAIEVSKSGWNDGSEYAILANGENFPDALAGSALAAKNSTCVLLISDYIGEATKKFAFDKLPSENNIKILGGQGAVSDKLVNKVIYPNVNEIIGLPKDVLSVRQGEWVYYSSDKYKSTKLSKCKVDGNSIQQLSDKWASQITVVGDWIYFMASEDDGTDNQTLSN